VIEWLKTATDLQLAGVLVGAAWVFAGLVSVHMIRHPSVGRRASRWEDKK